MDLQEYQRSREDGLNPHTRRKRSVYSKTLDPKHSYLNKIFCSQRNDAKSRKLSWNISLDEWIKLTQQNCHICGVEPKLRYGKIHDTIGEKTPINGLDRVENQKGYTLDNVKSCCTDCNYMKHKMTEEYFYKHIEKIWRFQCLPIPS